MEGAERQPEVGKEGLDWRDSSERSWQGLAWGTRPRWSEGARQAWARPWMGRGGKAGGPVTGTEKGSPVRTGPLWPPGGGSGFAGSLGWRK